MDVAVHDAESLAELMTIALAAGEQLAHPLLWYRGARCDRYQLVPKLLREGRTAEQVFDREDRMLTRFRQRSVAYWPEGMAQRNWEQLFAMQHYGLPTRLLDWSENLFVAAFFALEAGDHSDHVCVPTVSMLAPVAWNRVTPVLAEFAPDVHILTTADDDAEAYEPLNNKRRASSAVAIYGTHNSNRIVAQRGNFVVWGKDTRPMEALASDLQGEAALIRVRLTGDRGKLLADIRHLGFTETIVYPELPSLASELTRTVQWKDAVHAIA